MTDGGPGNNPALFICAPPWYRRRNPCRLETLMTAPYSATALEPEVTATMIVATGLFADSASLTSIVFCSTHGNRPLLIAAAKHAGAQVTSRRA